MFLASDDYLRRLNLAIAFARLAVTRPIAIIAAITASGFATVGARRHLAYGAYYWNENCSLRRLLRKPT